MKGQMSLFTEDKKTEFKFVRPVFKSKNSYYFKVNGRVFLLVKPIQEELVEYPEAEYILKEIISK